MPALASNLRNLLEKTIITAREEAEQAAHAAVATLAVAQGAPFAGMSDEQKQLRRALRARARQLGEGDQIAGLPLLEQEIAYEQWHRMLFARFLAENNLLIHPDLGVAVTLEECAELAAEEGASDAWELAARYAAAILPGIFPVNDPTVQIRLAPEGRHRLEQLVQNLPSAVFTSDDGLGWVYQFWQTKKKKAVNASGREIGSAEIGPVTQLFTEDYMVRFLLENSLGAWWAARHPDSPLLEEWDYLRWIENEDPEGKTRRIPAAGTFPGWPDKASQVTMLDPCGGSGHFVVAGFEMLHRMRMEEEGLSIAAAGDAVISDNIFMLEIDTRCTQLATFNLVLAAWKTGGYRPLPTPNIACSGIAVEGQLADWLKLAGEDSRLQTALEQMYHLFHNAPVLGSLINPATTALQGELYRATYDNVAPLLEMALTRERSQNDHVAAVLGAPAQGIVKAARLLIQKYTLVATNVPYLGMRNQNGLLNEFLSTNYEDAKINLATAFGDRCISFCSNGGTIALVTPQNWLFQSSYENLRKRLLKNYSWNVVARLGIGAFQTITGEVVNVFLGLITKHTPEADRLFLGLDADSGKNPLEKIKILRYAKSSIITQISQLQNPGSCITLERIESLPLLAQYVLAPQGIKTGDDDRWRKYFWEITVIPDIWRFYQSTVASTNLFGGRKYVLDWRTKGNGMIRPRLGNLAIGRLGVAIKQIGDLPASLYTGELYDSNVAPLVPREHKNLPAIWTFCSSVDYNLAVRRIDKGWKVSNVPLTQIPFDIEYWTQVAQEKYPSGLPAPYSNDLTQWLFSGHPTGSTNPLHVAVARLLGYNWPQQTSDALDCLADADGIVCLPAVSGEQPATERLRGLLMAAYNQPPSLPDPNVYNLQSPDLPFAQLTDGWSLTVQQRLLTHVGYAGKSLDDWLRDGFFEQHCQHFENRPFIWHLWDGRRDGFNALVNYHKLDHAALNRLIYTYLGYWIETQRAARDAGEAGADGRLVAALELQKKLEAIRDGEKPYDIYVRWKPLHEQPIGWQPDLNDGVRLNIRPFVHAGILRRKFTIDWTKDLGKNPDGTERINDRHYTRAEKEAARRAHGIQV